jgi:acyl carrier protein
VAGIDHLEQALGKAPLEYFMPFSSVTTLIGNPGQGSYVAANAYMEGLSRRRRQEGRPFTAVGWGPITDVGVVARDQRLRSGLQKLTGASGMRARHALDLMAQVIGPDSAPAVVTIAPNDGSFAPDRLAVLRSPTYAGYVGSGRTAEMGGKFIDLRSIASGQGVEAARQKAAEIVAAQLALILQLRLGDVRHDRPLGEIGLDSLMGLELVMNLEETFAIRVPLSGSSGEMTVADIAEQIVAHVGLDNDVNDEVAAKVAGQHHTGVDVRQLELLTDMVRDEPQITKGMIS